MVMKKVFNTIGKPAQLVLGTANFGNKYGIANATRTEPLVDFKKAKEIILRASSLGVSVFDTASTYGGAEKWLGEVSKKLDIEVWTKILIPKQTTLQRDEIGLLLKKSIDHFHGGNLTCIQIHNWSPNLIYGYETSEFIDIMRTFWAGKIGASTYGAAPALAALDLFDMVHFEFNLLNQATYQTLIAKVKCEMNNLGALTARSIYLQGLLFRDPKTIPLKLKSLSDSIVEIHKVADEFKMSPQELIVRGSLSMPGLSSIVIGVDSISQLEETVHYFNLGVLEEVIVDEISKLDNSSNPMVDPRNWNNS
jgi:aryl-alcohol dehydrogenase-like predicted oxidoreductase